MKKKWKILIVLFVLAVFAVDSNYVKAAEVTERVVESYTRYLEYDSERGHYVATGLFVVDGRYAFCIERSVDMPAVNSPVSEWIPLENEALRKVLYYGYSGPGDKGYSVGQTSLAAAEANGDGDTSVGVKILAEIMQYPSPPDNFLIWKVETNGGETQDLAFYTEGELTFEVELQKINDAGVGLKGAEFTVYLDEACTQEVVSGETDETGILTFADLNIKTTYYIKETKAPEGYQISDAVYEIYSDGSVEQSLIQQTIVNERNYKLPETGSYGMLFAEMAGIGCMAFSVMSKKRRR